MTAKKLKAATRVNTNPRRGRVWLDDSRRQVRKNNRGDESERLRGRQLA